MQIVLPMAEMVGWLRRGVGEFSTATRSFRTKYPPVMNHLAKCRCGQNTASAENDCQTQNYWFFLAFGAPRLSRAALIPKKTR
jgi:hypothetical protein